LKRIKVLIVDDSSLVRSILSSELKKDPEIEVIGTAMDPFQARDMIIINKPDVMTLDVEMPKMDGIEFLKRVMTNFPIPTIIISSLTLKGGELAMKAYENGAIDVVLKPSKNLANDLSTMIHDLTDKIKIASKINIQAKRLHNEVSIGHDYKEKAILSNSTDKVIAIGASTGGTEALSYLLKNLKVDLPGIVVVQHMPPFFTENFAKRLNNESKLHVKEAATDDIVTNGNVYIAPGGKQMRVYRSGGRYKIKCTVEAKVHNLAPSVSILFQSIAEFVGNNAIGIMLTGMGKDGAEEMALMRRNGAYNIGQDEQSCVVYGMPKAAKECGAIDKEVSLAQISHELYKRLETMGK